MISRSKGKRAPNSQTEEAAKIKSEASRKQWASLKTPAERSARATKVKNNPRALINKILQDEKDHKI